MATRPVMKVGNNFTHCGLVTPYGHIERVTIRSGNGVWHQTSAWANVDLSLARWSDIHPKCDFTKDTSATNINVAWNYSSKILFSHGPIRWGIDLVGEYWGKFNGNTKADVPKYNE